MKRILKRLFAYSMVIAIMMTLIPIRVIYAEEVKMQTTYQPYETDVNNYGINNVQTNEEVNFSNIIEPKLTNGRYALVVVFKVGCAKCRAFLNSLESSGLTNRYDLDIYAIEGMGNSINDVRNELNGHVKNWQTYSNFTAFYNGISIAQSYAENIIGDMSTPMVVLYKGSNLKPEIRAIGTGVSAQSASNWKKMIDQVDNMVDDERPILSINPENIGIDGSGNVTSISFFRTKGIADPIKDVDYTATYKYVVTGDPNLNGEVTVQLTPEGMKKYILGKNGLTSKIVKLPEEANILYIQHGIWQSQVSASIIPADAGRVDGVGTFANDAGERTLTAIANPNWEFDHWEVDGISYQGNTYVVTNGILGVLNQFNHVNAVFRWVGEGSSPVQPKVENADYPKPEYLNPNGQSQQNQDLNKYLVSLNMNARYDYATEVFNLVNEARLTANDSVNKFNYVMDKDLTELAMKRAAELALAYQAYPADSNTAQAHIRPDGTRALSILEGTTFATATGGENIAIGYPTPNDVMGKISAGQWHYRDGRGWMGSTGGHREAILSTTQVATPSGNVQVNYKSIGIGCVEVNGNYYWVQLFSEKESQNPINKTTSEASTFNFLSIDKNLKGLFLDKNSETINANENTKVTLKNTLGSSFSGIKDINVNVTAIDVVDKDIAAANINADGTVTINALKGGNTIVKIGLQSNDNSKENYYLEYALTVTDEKDPTPGEGENDPTPGEGENDPIPGEGENDPIPGGGENDPIPGEGENDPTPGEGENDPTPGEGENNPTPGEGENDPIPGEGENDPTPGEGENDPIPGEGENDPTPGEGENDPIPGEGENDPTPGEGENDPTPGEGENDPTPGEGENDPVPGEGENDPTPGEGENNPVPGEGENDPTPGEGENNPVPGEGETGSIPGIIENNPIQSITEEKDIINSDISSTDSSHNTSSNEKVPQTYDGIVPWIMLDFISLIGFIITIFYRKRINGK